ncbi:hypothetical protein BJV82DRAFT_294272 [Fennellomyces sp. T-0311]|nr:hypothetical protein BJV82DRAFT_294272 [Fennellomyces sp. T-0311]
MLCGVAAKERIQQELGLLHSRGKAMTESPINKVKKKTTMKRSANARQQKKIARALLVADKEEARIEKQTDKLEKKKLRKMVWS